MEQKSIPSPLQIDEAKDNGHVGLVYDMRLVFRLCMDYQFHDYKGTKFPSPKVALILLLEKIINRTKSGYYDNKHIV